MSSESVINTAEPTKGEAPKQVRALQGFYEISTPSKE